MKQLNITLSTDSISKAINELNSYKLTLNNKCKQIVEKLIDYGLNVCHAKVVQMDIPDTGNLDNSISGYYSPTLNAGFVQVDCEYAIFVEFGTGVKGTQTPYIGQAMAECGYQYMGGTHYITTKDGRIGWFYPADDGTWRFTQGLPSRPFMYETALDMRNNLDKIIKGVFK